MKLGLLYRFPGAAGRPPHDSQKLVVMARLSRLKYGNPPYVLDFLSLVSKAVDNSVDDRMRFRAPVSFQRHTALPDTQKIDHLFFKNNGL